MNNFEMEAARRLLFFSQSDAALMIGAATETLWREWEDGSVPIPVDVKRVLLDLLEWRQQALDAAVAHISDASVDTQIDLVWYDTLARWLTLEGRSAVLWKPQQSICAALLGLFPGNVRLVCFDLVRYTAWLGDREDSEPMRRQWAATV